MLNSMVRGAARASGGADRRWRSLRRAAEAPTEAAAETASAARQKRLTEPAGETETPPPTDIIKTRSVFRNC